MFVLWIIRLVIARDSTTATQNYGRPSYLHISNSIDLNFSIRSVSNYKILAQHNHRQRDHQQKDVVLVLSLIGILLGPILIIHDISAQSDNQQR